MEITILLLNRKTVTAKELSERFGVSTRTIYRDVEVLSSAGVPVYMSKGNGGGISLLEDYALNKALLSNKESKSLILALKTMQAAKYPEVDSVLEKVGSIFKNAADTDWVQIDFAGWSSFPNERNKFNDIKNAIFNKKIIEFDYINANGEKSHRKVEPERFHFNVHTWYLTAFCLNKNEHRVFRLSRIKNVKALDEVFDKRTITPVQEKLIQGYSKPFVHLKLRFSEQVLHRLYDEFDDSLITRMDDDSVLVDVTFPEDEWLYGFILSFGSYVEVLEPLHIREIVINRMKDAIKIYEK